MAMSAILPALVWLLFFGHLVGLALLLRNQHWMSWPPERRHRSSGNATVTVIVPARNEATDIARCLQSLLAQDYPKLKVIVINDHSNDDTPRIINEVAATDSRLVVIHDPPLRAGWLGKQNAMQTAFDRVDSNLVVLTDGDVEFNPACISYTVGELERRQLDLLSVYPKFRFISFCETMLLPFYVGGAAILLSPAVEDPRYRHAMAVGAFILLRTDRLKAIGGFESIKTDILDDIVMARRFKENGFTIGLRAAPDLMQLRFFKNNQHSFFGVTKHLLGAVQDCAWMAPLLALIPLFMYATLLLGLVYGVLHGQLVLPAISAVTLVIHYVALLLTRPGNSFNPIVALAFPFMSIQFAASCLYATYLLQAHGTFQWRGRNTDLRAARRRAAQDSVKG